MKKTKQTKTKTTAGQPVTTGDNLLHAANQEQVPFLYIAMKEPSDEYKQAGDSKQKLYRFIKIK